jgi:hypothetical protein
MSLLSRVVRSMMALLLVLATVQPSLAQQRASQKSRAATAQHGNPFTSQESILRWINGYRAKPEPQRIPLAVQAMATLGIFRDADSSGIYLGFVAGVLGSNPKTADALVEAMFPMPPEDQLAIIKAIAYSGLPGWKDLLRKNAERMPARNVLIDRYLTDKMPALADLALDAGPAPLDVLWGQYFATGSYDPILRIISVLKWSKDGNNVERLTIGSMAKWTLANNAARDMDLLRLVKSAMTHESKDTVVILREIIEAADIGDISRIRRDALASIETLKVKGPQSGRQLAWWGTAGQTALALGCIVASALGQAQVGIPCVIGGAISGAAIKILTPQQ